MLKLANFHHSLCLSGHRGYYYEKGGRWLRINSHLKNFRIQPLKVKNGLDPFKCNTSFSWNIRINCHTLHRSRAPSSQRICSQAFPGWRCESWPCGVMHRGRRGHGRYPEKSLPHHSRKNSETRRNGEPLVSQPHTLGHRHENQGNIQRTEFVGNVSPLLAC